MRRLVAPLALLALACSRVPTPARAPIAPGREPSAVRGAAEAPPVIADDGPAPDPPMAVRWTFELAPVAGRPGTSQRLAVLESGDATWDSVRAGGDAAIDEELSPTPPRAADVERCRGHIGPTLHRRLVNAARRAMTAGCASTVARDRRGRPDDAANATIAVTLGGEVTSCEVGRSGGSHAAFEALRVDVVSALCRRR